MKTPKQPKRMSAERLWEYALRSLGGRAHSTGELRLKLIGKAERQGDVDPIISRLKELGYLNDQSFADSFASLRREGQGFGRDRVLRDLRQRRVTPLVAERAVHKVFQDTDESALAENFVHRKFRAKEGVELFRDAKEFASAYRKLRRAGFSSSASFSVLKRYAAASIEESEPPEETEEA
jgi:regulatory protein